MATGSDNKIAAAVEAVGAAVVEVNAAWGALILAIAGSDMPCDQTNCGNCRHSGDLEKIARTDGTTLDVMPCSETVALTAQFGAPCGFHAAAKYVKPEGWCPLHAAEE